MTDAEKAYERAKELIAEAKAEGATRLSFDHEDTRALKVLPREISELTALQSLSLDHTQVKDLAPLTGLTNLTELRLESTGIMDLSPLRGLSALTKLWLELKGKRRGQHQQIDATKDGSKLPAGTGKSVDITGMRVLAADDNATNRMILRAMLHQLGVTTHVVSGGNEAIEAYRASSFDLLIIDINMPDRDGIDVMREIRAMEAARSIVGSNAPTKMLPIVGFAANMMWHQRETYHEAGFDDCLVKPLQMGPLREVLSSLIADRGRRTSPNSVPLRDELVAPQPPSTRPAPLQAGISGGRLVRAGGKALPKADPLVRAEAGWRALRAYRATFGSAFNLHNHHPLGAFLDAFDMAMGDRFDPENSILIGAMSGGIIALAGNGEFCGQLPVGAEPLLRQFAAQLQTYLNRFPDWTAYQEDAAGGEDNTASAAESFEALDEDLQASPDTDRDVAEIYDMQVRAALDPQSAEGTRKGLVASTGEVTRALAEKALDEVRSGQAVRGYVGSMDKVHDAEAAKVGWYAGGFAVVFIQRRKAHFRRLADTYPSRMGWLHGVLDYLFGAERD
ncbi:response regulator [Pararhodobacter zhoushanensis]|uniref:response regulator n=1 Tax=Pararhodobacter zhoushanensis TaxID=2479545 RepID=UPI0013DF3FC7|nr:response regulator [Pararhodobacter zhoushanensis]